MVPKIEDRWLWLGLGVFTFFAVKGVAYGLREIVRLTEVNNVPEEPEAISRMGGEDAIKTESLEVLATCPNIEIREAATKILCQRFYKNNAATRLLFADLQSPDPERRSLANKALKLVAEYCPINPTPLPSPQRSPGRDHPDFEPVHRHGNGVGFGRTARTHRESAQEQQLRRRRREAVVINEGDRPISQDDIIQAGGSGRLSERDARVAELALETLSRRDRNITNGAYS
jgi:hypothetical protein